MPIDIYSAEAEIKHLIENNAVAWLSPVISEQVSETDKSKFLAETDAQEKQIDLFYLKTILVTANSANGNLNGDWFWPDETWAARNTPEDKPFNNAHDCKQIIGHITGNYVIDDENNVIADDIAIDKLPSKFHIVTSAVIYKHWKDEGLKAKAEKLIEEIQAGKKYVSMEALFSNFDYIMEIAEGKWEITPRNKDTAYLTKHLRCYGGKGEYNGKKVQRLLRNMIFSGKGLVDAPANPESVILTTASNNPTVFIPTFWIKNNFENSNIDVQKLGNLVYTYGSDINPWVSQSWTNTFTSNIKGLSQMENDKALAEALAKIKDLETQLSEKNIEGYKTKITTLEAKVTELGGEVTAHKTKLDEAKALLEKAINEKKMDEEEMKKKHEAMSALTDELNKIKAAQKTQARIEAMKAKGKTQDEAVALEKKFAKVDDETFASILETFVPVKETKADLSLLENAKETKEPDLAIAGRVETDQVKELVSAVANLFAHESDKTKE